MPCLEPARLPGLMDYQGPLKQTVGIFAGVLDRKTGHQRHYKPASTLCSLKTIDKLLRFAQDSIDPVNLLSAGFSAGIDHASNRDPTFGRGAKGYAKRLGADLADSASSKFIKDFAYPAIFREDPRYYRLGAVAPANVFCMQPGTSSWPTTKTERACSTIRSGWEPRVLLL